MKPPSTPGKYPPISAFDETIEIKVNDGKDSQSFQVHKGVLCFYSGYFDSACNGSFRESKAKNISPITEGIEVFRTFIYWMYHRRFSENSTEEVSKTKWETVIKLWVFGDAHAIPMLQNAVIDLLHQKVLADWRVPIAEICLIYESTPPGSILRKYVIDLIARTGYADTVVKPEYEQYWCKDALIDLVRIVWDPTLKTQGKGDVRNWSMCEYHVHEEGVKCSASGPTLTEQMMATAR